MQVPPGTVVYLPEAAGSEKELEGDELEELPYWLRNPGQPWIGAVHYSTEDDSDAESPEVSSESTQKRKLGREIADLRDPGDRILLAKGGDGGKGNAFLPTAVRK